MGSDKIRSVELDQRKVIGCCLSWSNVPKTYDQGFQQKDQASNISNWRLGNKAHHSSTRRSQGKMDPHLRMTIFVKKVFSGGTMMLTTMDGKDFPHPVNADIVKKYYT